MAKKSYVENLKNAIRGHNYSYVYSSGSCALQKKTSYEFSEKLYAYLRKACGHNCEVVLSDFDEESLKREREFSDKAYEAFKANGFKPVVKEYKPGGGGKRAEPVGHIPAMTDEEWNRRGWRVPFTSAEKKRLKKLKYGKGAKLDKTPYVMDDAITRMYPTPAKLLNIEMETGGYLSAARPLHELDKLLMAQSLETHEDPEYPPALQAALKEAEANAPTIVLDEVNDLNLYSDATNYRKFPEIGDVKVEVGFGEAEPAPVPLEERPFLFREHRGGFAESMATMHELEGTKASLLTYLKGRMLISADATPEMVEVTHYANDPRGWLDTYIVVSKDPAFEGVLGYTNGPLADCKVNEE